MTSQVSGLLETSGGFSYVEYHKLPLISPVLLQLCKGFGMGSLTEGLYPRGRGEGEGGGWFINGIKTFLK